MEQVDNQPNPIQQADADRQSTLANEPDLLAGLLAAGSDKQNRTAKIVIQRGGQTFFSFRIRPLSEQEYKVANDKATPLDKDGNPDRNRVDVSEARSLLIYTATVQEDRTKLWDNQAAWTQMNVLSGADLIDKVLLAGEKQNVIGKIDSISGFDSNLEDQAKN